MANFLIIGGNSGIGLALIKRLIDSGHQVWQASREQGDADLEGVHWQPWSLEGEASLELPDTLDGLAYCPGTVRLKPFHRISIEEFREDYEVNVIGAVSVIQQALPALKKSQSASVVLFSSVAAQQGMGFHASIGAAKAAVEGLTRSLAAELIAKVRVNAIAPSLTDTPLVGHLLDSDAKKEAASKRHPINQIGDPNDIAALAEFLLSDHSKFVTGQVYGIDGGLGSVRT